MARLKPVWQPASRVAAQARPYRSFVREEDTSRNALLGETRKIMERVLERESRVVGLRVHGRELREALLGCPEFGSFVAVCAARRGAPEIGEAELRHVLGLLGA